MLDRYIKLILKYPLLTIGSILIISIVMASGIPKLKFDNSLEVMMPKKDSQYLYYEEVKKVHGNLGKFIIMNVTGPDVWSPSFLRETDNLITDLEEYIEFDENRETNRLDSISRLSSGGNISADQVVEMFNTDQPLQREIVRFLDLNFPGETTLRRKQLNRLHSHLKEIYLLKKEAQIDVILSPHTAKDISGAGDTLSAIDIIDQDPDGNRIVPQSAEEIRTFRRRLTKNPAFDGALYSRDRKTGEITDFCVMIKLENIKKDDEIAKRIWDIARGYKTIKTTPQGVPIVGIVMNDHMHHDLYHFLPLVMLVVLIIFFINFRSVRGVILPFCTLILADTWVLGLMGHLGFNITIIGVSLPPLIIAVGSSYSIHILNQYYLDFDEISSLGKKRGLRVSMAHIGITIVLAGLTTFIGFISLLTNQVVGIREWGLFTAIGVLFAVIISASLITAGLALLPHKKTAKKIISKNGGVEKTRIDILINLFIRLSTRHPKAVLAGTLVVIILSFIGLYQVQVETALSAYFKKHDYVRTSGRLIADKYGGAYGMSILVDSGETDGVKDPEFLKLIEEIREWLVSHDELHIGRTDAFPDVIKTMHRAMNNDNIAYYKIPERRADIMDYLEVYSGDDENFDGRVDEFEPYVDPEYRTALIFARLGETGDKILGTAEMKTIQGKISSYLEGRLPRHCSYKITGEPTIFIRLSEYVVQGQLYSLLFSLGAVSLIVVLLFKNWKAGALSLIPMSVAVIINFGVMGWSGIRLDVATAIIASITIGIGIDDTIHFLNTYRHFKKQELSTDEIIARTLSISGKAIIYTSLALMFGFSVLVVSNFSPVIYFGILAGNTMLATTLGALLVLPSVIKSTGVNLDETDSTSWFWRYFYIGRFFNIGSDDDV